VVDICRFLFIRNKTKINDIASGKEKWWYICPITFSSCLIKTLKMPKGLLEPVSRGKTEDTKGLIRTVSRGKTEDTKGLIRTCK
jgi:hypothetical protein